MGSLKRREEAFFSLEKGKNDILIFHWKN